MPVLRKRVVLIFLIVVAALLILISFQKVFVEENYTYGFYPPFSRSMRFLFGWSRLSFGDVIYFVAFVWVLFKIVKNVRLLFLKRLTGKIAWRKLRKLLIIFISLYIIFMAFWGLNYSRKGIAYQLQLPTPVYEIHDLLNMQDFVLLKTNEFKQQQLLQGNKDSDNAKVFEEAVKAYHKVEHQYSFLKYRQPSIKSSMYGSLGNYLGFTGYYNPFTGEAQVNTTVPQFLLPSITTHEMAHQLGYAKENEANFVGFLAASASDDPGVRYSTYLDIFIYANSQLRLFDSSLANASLQKLLPEVKSDIATWRKFNLAHQSFLEPAIRWLYGNYLRLNQQPQGMRSYNEVVSMLIAYYKKTGIIP